MKLISTEYELGHHHLLFVYHLLLRTAVLTRQTGSTSPTYLWTTSVNGCESFASIAQRLLTSRPWLEVGWLANVPIFDGKLSSNCPIRQS